MTKRIASTASPSTRWQFVNDVWSLIRDGRRIAVIEPSWDDHHWFLFSVNADGGHDFCGARQRIVALKLCLLIWARRNPNGIIAEEAPL